MTSIQLLGGATIRCDGALVTGPPAQRHRTALLALVAASWPHALARDRAMALLWPEHDAERARRLLNLAVHVLRRALGERAIVSGGDGLLFDPDAAACDLHAFRAALAAGNHDGAADAYAGPFLDGFHLPEAPEFHFWLDERRTELAHALEGALLAQAEARRLAGDVHGHVGACRRLTAADPWSGRHARALMLALDAAGDRAGAIRHAQEHARRLHAELELEPDPDTVALLRTMQATREPLGQNGSAVAGHATASPALPPNPPRDLPPAGTGAEARSEPVTVAVVAVDEGTGPDAQLTADMRDRLVSALLRLPSVRVAALGDARLRLLAASGADHPRTSAVLEARARAEGDAVTLRLRMVDTDQGVFLLSSRLERDAAELDVLAEEAADVVVAALRARSPSPATRPTSEYDLEEARLLCAKGQHLCGRREQSALLKAVACFEQARALAPGYGPAWTGLASAYAIMGFYDLMPPREAFSLAREAARTALALNPADPACHASLGYIAEYFEWNWTSAERELHTAIQLDPQYALAYQWLGNYLVLRGEHEAAVVAMQKATRLAPHSAIAAAATGWACYFAGDHDRAFDFYAEAADLDPLLPMTRAWRGLTLLDLGRHDDAVAELRAAAALMPGSAAFRATLAQALATAGDHVQARDILRQLSVRRRTDFVPSFEVAKAHLALGDRQRALRWLEAAHRERSHSMSFLRVDPHLRPLHDEPRFRQLVGASGHG